MIILRFRWIFFLTVLLSNVSFVSVQAFERAKNKAGKPIYWPRASTIAVVKYHIHESGLDDYFKQNPQWGALGSEFQAVQNAFLTWSFLTCPDNRPIGLSLQFQGKLTAQKATVGYDANCSTCNTNLVVFIRDRNLWRHNELILAQTTVTPNETTGEILDADIEINASGRFSFSTQIESPENIKWDIQSVMAHEVGRFLGLDTSTEPNATMAAKANEGSLELRSLEKDDITGMCTIYPPNEKAEKIPLYQEVQAGRALGCSSLPSSPLLRRLELWLILIGLGMLVLRRFTDSRTKVAVNPYDA